ncbi:MAG: hypothetical protein ACE5HV_09495 [Acidobacteriota bacterium]
MGAVAGKWQRNLLRYFSLLGTWSILLLPTASSPAIPLDARAQAETVAARPTAAPPLQLPTAVHVHSTASTGRLDLDSLSLLARDQGVEAVVLSENLVLRIRYAPWPLHYFFELQRQLPSLSVYGIRRHLREIAAAQERHPEVLLLPGVEVMPYVYWTGSPIGGDLTLHDMQRNVLVIPPIATLESRSADEAQIATGDRFLVSSRDTGTFFDSMPAIGNPGAESYGWGSLLLFLPGFILALAGSVRLATNAAADAPRSDSERKGLLRGHGSRLRAFLLLGLGIGLLVSNFPYTEPVIRAYDPAASLLPYQRLSGYVRGGGGLVFWSMPEAVDDRRLQVGPIPVRLLTNPYPQALVTTEGYTGVGGVYADTVTILEPGALWDRLLLAYCRRERPRPPWMIGESAFHFSGQAGKHLGDVLTVLLVEEKSRAAAYEALGHGHSYALRKNSAGDLRLGEFTLGARQGGKVAWPGDTLELAGGDRFELTVQIISKGDEEVPVHVEVIRQGLAHLSWNDVTPFRRQLTESLAPGEGTVYYRLDVEGPRPLHIASNPIFVRRR